MWTREPGHPAGAARPTPASSSRRPKPGSGRARCSAPATGSRAWPMPRCGRGGGDAAAGHRPDPGRHPGRSPAAERLDHVVVVNLASTEPPPPRPIPLDFTEVEPLLDDAAGCPLPASSLYFLAAAEAGASYVNFTPVGRRHARLPRSRWPSSRGIAQAGCDGKTGETLLKSVLAPMFAARNLEVMSWVGHNIFGNLDGQVLDDRETRRPRSEQGPPAGGRSSATRRRRSSRSSTSRASATGRPPGTTSTSGAFSARR